MTELLVVAGEASGDLHAARLLSEIRRRVPDLHAFGLGGDELRAAGLEAVAHSREIAVVGIVEVLKIYRRARQIFDALLAEVDRRRPRFALLVDFPDFNLRLARELNRRGVRVLYYVSPQVWAWRRGRVRTIAQRVDTMLVLFSFEAPFYAGHGVRVVHVGHPLVDEVPANLAQAWDGGPPAAGEPYRLALLPGSRRSELRALLPTLLATAGRIAAQLPLEVVLPRAATIDPEFLAPFLAASPVPVRVVTQEERFEAVAGAHLALCASGTATLEVALLRTPLVVVYRLSGWTSLLARLLVKLPHFSLVNLVLGRPVVPERFGREVSPDRLAADAVALLRDPQRIAAMRRDLADVRGALGAGGASGRAADVVAERLLGSAAPELAAAGEGR